MKELLFTTIFITVSSLGFAQQDIPSLIGSSYFKEGNGDDGTFNAYNSFLSLHFGLGIGSPYTLNVNGSYEEKAMIAFNGRTGDISSRGYILANSIESRDKITIPASNGMTYFKDGTADGGNFNSYNNLLSLHWGLGIGSRFTSNGNGGFEEKAMIILNGRSGEILTLGGIGIGTQNFGPHKLAVEGSIGAREVKVQANGWSDFVFEKDYYLPSLDEVAAYINQNGHLKDIPSAAEVEKEGIFLGEMNSKLLQKIEELTLYILKQHRSEKQQIEINRKQSELIGKLEKRIRKLENQL